MESQAEFQMIPVGATSVVARAVARMTIGIDCVFVVWNTCILFVSSGFWRLPLVNFANTFEKL